MKDMKLGEVLPATQGAVDTKSTPSLPCHFFFPTFCWASPCPSSSLCPAASVTRLFLLFRLVARLWLAFTANLARSDIAKYFGQSTADGIGFQFRSIKKDAEKLRKVETEGGDVASALLGDIGTASSSTVVTPSKPTASRGTASTGKRPRARNATVTSKKEVSSDSDGIEEIPNFSELDEPSPTKRPRPAPPVRALSQNNNHHTLQPLPSRQRSAGPSEEVHGESSASSMDVLTPSSPAPSASAAPASASAATPRPGKSLFGPVPSKTQTPKRQEATVPSNAFRANAVDAYVGSQGQDPSASYNSASSAYSTGEI